MSSEALAITRKNQGDDLKRLAEEHFQHDLQQSDRDTVRKASGMFARHAAIGSLIGVTLGALLAYRVRSNRTQMFNAFKTKDKPTHVQFADGRTEVIPDLTPLLRPTRLGDVATYFFLSLGGLFIGGETGAISGSVFAGRAISKDPESRVRIMTAYKRLRADILRKEADMLDRIHM